MIGPPLIIETGGLNMSYLANDLDQALDVGLGSKRRAGGNIEPYIAQRRQIIVVPRAMRPQTMGITLSRKRVTGPPLNGLSLTPSSHKQTFKSLQAHQSHALLEPRASLFSSQMTAATCGLDRAQNG